MNRYFCLMLLAAMASAQDARVLFAKHCAVCHGDGRGTERGPDLANSRRVRSRSVDEVRNMIRNGTPAAGMPAFDLPAADLDALTRFVKSLGAPAIDAGATGDRAAGERYFFAKGGCAGCHMVMSRGKAVGPDLSSIGREATLAEIQRSVREPAARVKPGYSVVRVKLADGSTIRGFARNRNRYNIQVQDFDGRFHMLGVDQTAEIAAEPGSLMKPPACSDAECRDVVAYLASLGGVAPGHRGTPLASESTRPFAKGDWPTYHGESTGNRHSPLDQITTANVKDLALKWVFPVNHFVLQVTPVVVDGVMYVTGPNQVFALDARHGRTIWHYQRSRGVGVRGDPSKGTNRGVAVSGDRVFMITDNARLLALHRVTGALLWETNVRAGIEGNNYGSTAAPLVVNDAGGDLVVSGISGGDLGMRGFLTAFDAKTGELAWRFWTVPKPGEPLSEGWKGSALAQFGGGGGTWMTGTHDPETGLLYWGVGNPYPALNGDERKGDNLYTGSVLALEAKTGKLRWHYQFTPHDLWDWDAGQTPMLLNHRYRGRDRKLLIQANRNGFLYVLDRTNGELLLAEKFVDRLNWASGIGKDGRPILLPGREPTRDGTVTCPNILGATNWPSVAFNPATSLFYVMSREACGLYSKSGGWSPKPVEIPPGQMFLRAFNLETGKRVWQLPQIGPADSWGGVLSTAGGVVFFGEDSGALGAADAKTGADLWHVQTNASTEQGDGHSWRASPMTFLAGGRQHIAVANGPNILCFGLP